MCLGIALGGVPRFPLHTRPEPSRDIGYRIHDTAAAASTDCDHHSRAMATANDHVLGSGRAMEVVPTGQSSLPALYYQQTFAGQDKEPLLSVLAVVHP